MRKTRILGVLLLFIALIFAGRAEAASEKDYYYYDYEHFHYYQLRDVSGVRDGHTIAGAQWFATITDWTRLWEDPLDAWGRRPDTEGGQAPGVPMVTSADLLSNFDGVYMEDPEHYRGNYYSPHIPPIYPDPNYRLFEEDLNFDPIESVYLVIPEGHGEMRIDFGNDQTSHYPPVPDIFASQDAMEDILVEVPGYTTTFKPNKPQLVSADKWLPIETTFSAEDSQNYGSSLGYLTFRQSASFDVNFSGWRESIKIPIVVANVHNGPASDPGNELYFDMSIFGTSGDIVTRKKFRWGASENMTQDLGTFFMVQASGAMPTYRFGTQVTNRTGVRYRQQRYDSRGTSYQDIYPVYWSYDIPRDLYGTLPESFALDLQSQIAPGLVTHYLADMDMTYSSSESFRLYPFADPIAPRDLRLTFRKVRGMAPYGTVSAPLGAPAPWSVTGFHMTFVDVVENAENTEREITKYTTVPPAMPALPGYTFANVGTDDVVSDTYINSEALSAFVISKDVPIDIQVTFNASGDIVSHDKAALLPVRVRLTLPRQDAALVGQWDKIENADSVIDELAKTYAIWVRSPYTMERDLNLFTSLANRGYDVKNCMQAFTYGNFLYIDFIALLADSVSPLDGKSAFCYVVEDDKIPYILIGDGNIDNAWKLGFYVAKNGAGPDTDDDAPKPVNPDTGGGGGGCNQSGASVLMLALIAGTWLVKLGLSRKRVR
ncbi:hypothetical protein AGMMS50276_19200 [Synergistales bacterium]|nr:hypothetical protein AGMMS50276_19200 [Synergistales bacterium]